MARFRDCIHGRNSAFCPYGCEPDRIEERVKAVKAVKPASAPRPAAVKKAAAARVPGASKADSLIVRETEQEVLYAICDALEVPHRPIRNGVNLPVQVLKIASGRLGMGYKIDETTTERIVRKAGLAWETSYVVVDPLSEAEPALSPEGLKAVRDALVALLG